MPEPKPKAEKKIVIERIKGVWSTRFTAGVIDYGDLRHANRALRYGHKLHLRDLRLKKRLADNADKAKETENVGT